MQKLVFTNGSGQTIDLTSGNFGITNWEGLSGVGLNIQTQQVPFQDGGVFLDALMEQREISVTVAIQDNNDLSARYERKRQLISALNPKLGEGVLVYTNDYLSRQIKAVPQLPIFENKNSNDAGTLKASVVFSCPSPYWEDLEDTVVSVKGDNEIFNNGDIPTQIKLTIPAGSKNPIIRNQQEQKLIALNGSFENEIDINTNIGEKSVTSKEIGFAWEKGGSFTAIAKGAGKTVYVGTQIVVEDNYTGKFVSVNSDFYYELQSITYGNGLFVAVGVQGVILTSSDGINWENHNITGSNLPTFFSVTYGNGIYMILGYARVGGRRTYTSSDGVNWNYVASDNRQSYNSVTYGNGLFVAVGGSGEIASSSDGTSWTTRTSGTSSVLNFIIYLNELGLFIIVGRSGVILTSPDGITWTSRTSGVSVELKSVSYGNAIIVVVGKNGNIITSPDGINWTSRTSGVSVDLNASAYGNGLFCVAGAKGFIETSVNGIIWTIKNSSEGKVLFSVIYGKGIFVYFGASGVIQTSTDRENWTKRESGVNVSLLCGIYKEGLFVVCGESVILTSSDGITWVKTQETYADINSITYGNDLFVAVGDAGRVYTSNDGINWTESLVIQGVEFRSITYSELLNLFVALDVYGGYITSQDGLSWTRFENVFGTSMQGVIYKNDLFVAVGFNGATFTSPDGIIWTNRTSGVSEDLHAIGYGVGLFVAVGKFGTVITSPDGINWTKITTGIGSHFYGIGSGENDFVIVGTDNIVAISVITSILNLISSLVYQSDMTFDIAIGKNNILFSDENNKTAILIYRQKYIGV